MSHLLEQAGIPYVSAIFDSGNVLRSEIFEMNRLKIAFLATLSLTFCFSSNAGHAQDSEQSSSGSQVPTITVRSNLVLVPVLVRSKTGQIIFSLTASDFILTDDGIRQAVQMEPDTLSQPLALAVIVQTGGLGASHLADYRRLG